MDNVLQEPTLMPVKADKFEQYILESESKEITEQSIPKNLSESKEVAEDPTVTNSSEPTIVVKLVKISENIININPVPIYIKTRINDIEKITKELVVITSNIPNSYLYTYGNRPVFQMDESNKKIFPYDGIAIPVDNMLTIKNEYIDLFKSHVLDGISEFLTTTYNFKGSYSYNILNSYIQKYKDGSFLSPNDSILNATINSNKPYLLLKIAYYVNDGIPDTDHVYSGHISFINDNKLFSLKPQTGNLFIWENGLMCSVHPFYSKSEIECTVLYSNILIELNL